MEDEDGGAQGDEEEEDQIALMAKKLDFYKEVDKEEFF